jgi:hypothetical protein
LIIQRCGRHTTVRRPGRIPYYDSSWPRPIRDLKENSPEREHLYSLLHTNMEPEVDVLRNTYRFPVACSQGCVSDLTYISHQCISAGPYGLAIARFTTEASDLYTSKQICFSHALQQSRGQVGKRNQEDIQRLTSTGYTR